MGWKQAPPPLQHPAVALLWGQEGCKVVSPWFLFGSLALEGASPMGLFPSCSSACLLCHSLCDCEVWGKSLGFPSLLVITQSRLLSLLTPGSVHAFLCWKSVIWKELVTMSALVFGVLGERLQHWIKGYWLMMTWLWSLSSPSILKNHFYLLRRKKKRWKQEGSFARSSQFYWWALFLLKTIFLLIHRVSVLLSRTLPWQKFCKPIALQRTVHISLKNIPLRIHFDITAQEMPAVVSKFVWTSKEHGAEKRLCSS